MFDATAMAAVAEGICELLSQPELFVQLPKCKKAAIAGNLCRRWLDQDRR